MGLEDRETKLAMKEKKREEKERIKYYRRWHSGLMEANAPISMYPSP